MHTYLKTSRLSLRLDTRHDGGGGGVGVGRRLWQGRPPWRTCWRCSACRPRPLVLVLGGGVIHGAWGGQHNSPLDRKVDPLPLPPLAAPSQRDPVLEGHVEVCGPEPHILLVAAKVERAQRPHVDALRHWAEGLFGERARGPGAPSLAVLPPGAFVLALPANVAPHEAAINFQSTLIFAK